MTRITETWNKHFNMHAENKEDVLAHIHSDLDGLDEIISGLEHPRYLRAIRLVVELKEAGRQLKLLEREIRCALSRN